jgi:hypothetical protein
MIVMGVVVFALGLAVVGYLLARGSRVSTITEDDFDDAYDELIAKGEVVDEDRKAAWQEFNAWQVTNEKERLTWEEEADG